MEEVSQEEPPSAPQPVEHEKVVCKDVSWYAGHILFYSFVPVVGPALAVIHSAKAQPDPTRRNLARASLIITAALTIFAALVMFS